MKLPVIIVSIVLLTGCVRQNYYLSPFHAISNPYHTIPLKSDHIRSASYINSSISVGDANRLRNDVLSFHGEYYRAHSFGNFEAYYGGNFSLGYYKVSSEFYGPTYSSADSFIVKSINDRAGIKNFAGYGVTGGIAIVIPYVRRGGEWRILGIEFSMQNEFGQYLKFRRTLPDSIATANTNASFFPTIGITTEAVGRLKHSALSYKLALGTGLRNENLHYIPDPISSDNTPVSPVYFSQTINYTRDRGWSVYYAGILASHSIFLQLGFIRQLGNKKYFIPQDKRNSW
jgi:hypothetical protein